MGTSRGLVTVEGRIAPWGPRVEPWVSVLSLPVVQEPRTQDPGPKPQGGWEGDSVPTPKLLVDLVAEAVQPLL